MKAKTHCRSLLTANASQIDPNPGILQIGLRSRNPGEE
jgi:hypothetical protein